MLLYLLHFITLKLLEYSITFISSVYSSLVQNIIFRVEFFQITGILLKILYLNIYHPSIKYRIIV